MPVLLLALLWLIPTIAAAQTAPVLGLGLGITKQAAPLMETCGGNPRTLPTIELMAGVASGAWRAEARGEAFSALVVNDCLTAGPLYEGGSHTDRAYPFERERNHQWYGTYAIRVRAELRLR
jgi:hypothetical protein